MIGALEPRFGRCGYAEKNGAIGQNRYPIFFFINEILNENIGRTEGNE